MKISAYWFGSSGYAAPEQEDIEYFDSIQEAKDTFWSRYRNSDLRTPCVEDNCEMWLAKGIVDNMENGPDYVLTIGPRKGIRLERS